MDSKPLANGMLRTLSIIFSYLTVHGKSARLSKIVSFIGAGVVLATFVVKDVMKENLKDVNDSLGSAQNFYLSQTYNIFIQDDLSYIKQEVDLALSALQSSEKNQFERRESVLRASAQAGNDHLNVVIEYVRNLASLIDKLQNETDKRDQVRILLVRCAQLSIEIKSLQNRIPQIFSLINHNSEDPQALARLTEFTKDTEPIPGKTQSIMEEATKLTQSVVSDLAARKEETERNYERTTNLSYVLFALGWIIGLAGQLLGVGGQAES
jgi:hypothetical protein